MLSAQEGLTAFCVEVDVNDRGAFLFAEHDERDSLSRPYGEGYGLIDEVAVILASTCHEPPRAAREACSQLSVPMEPPSRWPV